MQYQKNTYCLKQDVFLFVRDRVVQLLDFHRGQFYGLDTVATMMVSSVLEQGVEATIASITQTYDITENQVCTDLTNLLQDLERKNLLVVTDQSSNPFLLLFQSVLSEINRVLKTISLWFLKKISFLIKKLLNPQQDPNFLTINLLLRLSWLSFRLLGWGRTLSIWQSWHGDVVTIESSKQQEIIKYLDHSIRQTATDILFFPIVCKERALVGYHLLRTFYKLPATLVVGVDRHPFEVHAWVECDNQILTDDPAYCQPFTPIVRYS